MKNLKMLFNIIIAAGAVILFGTAGLSDNSFVEFEVIVVRAAFAFGLIVFGMWGKYVIKQYAEKMKRRYRTNLNAAIRMMKA